VLRAIALLALLAAWPASATPIFKDGFERMSTSRSFAYPQRINDSTYYVDEITIVPFAESVWQVGFVFRVEFNLPGPPAVENIKFRKWELRNASNELLAGDDSGDATIFNNVGFINIGSVVVREDLSEIDIAKYANQRLTVVLDIDPLPPGGSLSIETNEIEFLFQVFDFRMTGNSSATAGRTDRINIAPRLGGLPGSSSVNVIVNLGGGRRETSFRAQSGSVLTIPRAAPSMRGLAPSGTVMEHNLRRLRPTAFSASSAASFTLPATARIGATIVAAGSSSATADVRALRQFAASFAGGSSATGSTTKVATVTALASAGTVLTNGLYAAQQFLVSFTAESGSSMTQGLNILAPFHAAGSSMVIGSTASLYRGPADFNVGVAEGWSVDVSANNWSVWV